MMRLASVLLLIVTVLHAAPRPVRACSFSTRAIQGEGVLGFPLGGFTSDGREVARPLLPRNAAFLDHPARPIQVVVDGVEVELVELGPEPRAGDLQLVTVAEPLAAGSLVEVVQGRGGDGPFRVGESIDGVAPEAPVLDDGQMRAHEGEGTCASDSCGNFASVSFALEAARDDSTPPEHMVYAIYFGRSREAARNAELPVAFVLREEDELFSFVDFGWGERDVYATVTAIDQAGNESGRSEVLKVYDSPGACAAAIAGRHATLAWLLLAVCLVLQRRRTLGTSPRQ